MSAAIASAMNKTITANEHRRNDYSVGRMFLLLAKRLWRRRLHRRPSRFRIWLPGSNGCRELRSLCILQDAAMANTFQGPFIIENSRS